LSFADLLRQEVAKRFEVPMEYLRHDKGRLVYVPLLRELMGPGVPEAVTIRQLLQFYGTDYTRARDPGYWLAAMYARVDQEPRGVIIDDVRFVNEADWILDAGGYLVRLEVSEEWWEPGVSSEHVSETGLDDYENFHESVSLPKGDEYTTDYAAALVMRLERMQRQS
jgi:hypothetical protein